MKLRVFVICLVFLSIAPEARNIELMEFLKQPQFSQFYSMTFQARDSGIAVSDMLLKRLNKYTLFIPTDTGINLFGKIGFLRDPGNEKLFLDFVKSHVVEDIYARDRLRQVTTGRGIKTLTDNKIYIAEENGVFYAWSTENQPKAERAQILYTVVADNGIIHVLDRVLLQPTLKARLDKIAQSSRYTKSDTIAGQQILVLAPHLLDTKMTATSRNS